MVPNSCCSRSRTPCGVGLIYESTHMLLPILHTILSTTTWRIVSAYRPRYRGRSRICELFGKGLVGGHFGVTSYFINPLVHELFQFVGYIIRIVLDREHRTVLGYCLSYNMYNYRSTYQYLSGDPYCI